MSTNGILCKVRKLSNILITQRSSCECPNKCIKTQWDITQVMGCNGKNLVKYGVLVLNRPILQKPNFIKKFWNNASVRITVDGGTCQWDKFLKLLPEEEQQSIHLPDLVTGDFDSITDEVLQKYKKKGCKIIHTPDQDHTDFTKALMELNKYCTEHKTEINHAVAIAQASGRIDQILGNVQTLYLAKLKQLLPSTKVYLMSDDAVSWLLFPGEHIIFIPEETRKHKRSWCSLVPMGEICDTVTTSGLKWNLGMEQIYVMFPIGMIASMDSSHPMGKIPLSLLINNTRLKFGELVSTSNAFDGSEHVTVKCSHTILWSMKIPGTC